MLKYTSGDPIGVTRTMPTENPSSDPRAHPISDPDALKQARQEAQESLQIYLILFVLHNILSSSSRQRDKRMRQQGSLRISHIGIHELYYDNRSLFLSTKSQIYDRDKRE